MHSDLPVIRSITLFIPRSIVEKNINEPNNLRKTIEELYDKYIVEFGEFLEEKGLVIWTKRLTLPLIHDLWRTRGNRIIDILLDIVPKDTLINTGGIYIDDNSSTELLKNLVEKGLYTGLLWRNTPSPRRIIDVFTELSTRDPIYATRVAVSLKGEPLMTPYYPLSTSLSDKLLVGIALLYPNFIIQHMDEGRYDLKSILEDVHARITGLLEEYGINGFIDHSISPWMDDSVARLLEILSGEKFWRPGIVEGVVKTNTVPDYSLT